jgi:hypothetical protein
MRLIHSVSQLEIINFSQFPALSNLAQIYVCFSGFALEVALPR